VAGKRGPIIAGGATALILIVVALFLVLPKMGQVKDANNSLGQAQSQQGTLSSQLAALKQAQADAPKNREIIRKVQQAIPPTADQQGFLLLLQNAALQSSVDVVTVTPNTPVFDPTTGLSTITNSLSATGSYFAVTEFLFQIETLPRAAKVTSVSLAPASGGAGGGTIGVTLTANVDVFTSDTSAGPGSSPGPTSAAGTATGTGVTTTPSSASPAAITTGA